MSDHSSTVSHIPADVLDQAIHWMVKLRSGTMDTLARERLQSQLLAWRAAAPVHETAWQELQIVEQGFTGLQIPVSSAFKTLEIAQQHRQIRHTRRKALRVLGLGVFGIGVGAVTATQQPVIQLVKGFAADYATAVGERRTVALADGTEIHLNTNTAIDVRYGEAQRLVILKYGEIFIQTGKDADVGAGLRPFFVNAGESRLQAIGTQFLVQKDAGKTRLQVTEGRVAIRNASAIVASAGDTYLIDDAGKTSLIDHSDFDATGWLDGALVARQMRLGDLVAQLARYRRGWLRCDPAIADLRVSGVFQINDTDKALEALVQTLPISLVKHTRYWVNLRSV